MSRGAIALAAVAAYVAVPIVMRMRVGCPPFGAKVVTTSSGQSVQACAPLSLRDVLLWPAGLLAGRA